MTPPLKPRKNYAISRIDQPAKHNHGWRVRIGGDQRFFSDGIYNGKRRSREAAENFRDDRFRELPSAKQRAASKPRRAAK